MAGVTTAMGWPLNSHQSPRAWRHAYGADHEYTPRIQDRLRHLLEADE